MDKENSCRFSRQIKINGWGEDGQARLKNSTVAVAGCGGSGERAGARDEKDLQASFSRYQSTNFCTPSGTNTLGVMPMACSSTDGTI